MTASTLNGASHPGRSTPLSVGEAVPWFHVRSADNPRFAFGSVAGRYVVLAFLGAAAHPDTRQFLDAVAAHTDVFNNARVATFGVFDQAQDDNDGRVAQVLSGNRVFWDHDQAVARQLGALGLGGQVQRMAFVLDMRLRVLALLPLDGVVAPTITRLLDQLPKLAQQGRSPWEGLHAPVLVVPRVFGPQLCQKLRAAYDAHGGEPSGFMRDIDGRTVVVSDAAHKRRRDHLLIDPVLRRACLQSLTLRLLPQVHNAFQFRATQLERHMVSCYDASEQGHFRRHRDNTTLGTAHRRFAVSLFLNTGEYEGGSLTFPEYGPQLFTAPAGGAVVFSCSMLHEATPVTRGKRYMYLPFLFDEAGAEILARNRHALQGSDDADASDGVAEKLA